MNPRSLWSGKSKKWLVGGGATALAVLASCAFLRISCPHDVEAYFGMASECHPLWRQFAFRRYGAGDSATDLLRRYPPSYREEFGRYGVYRYYKGKPDGIAFTGLSVVTSDGKLVSAGAASCDWQFTFFHTQDPDINRQYEAFLKERHERFERQRLAKLETALQKFHSQNDRWPTNQEEFVFFVTGSRNGTANDLGVALVQRPDGGMDIAPVESPKDARLGILPDGMKRVNP